MFVAGSPCAARSSSETSASILIDRPGTEAILDARHDLVGAQRRTAVRESEPSRVSRSAPVGRHDERVLQDRRPVRAVRAVRSSGHRRRGARYRHANSRPPRPAARARWRQMRWSRRRCAQELAVDLDRGEVSLETEDQRADALVRREEVDPSPDRHDPEPCSRPRRSPPPARRARTAGPVPLQADRSRSWSTLRGGTSLDRIALLGLPDEVGRPSAIARAARHGSDAERHDEVSGRRA